MELYAMIDLALPRDPNLVAAGPLARLLYVQAWLFSKENLTDGHINEVLLPLVAVDIPNPKKHMAALVRTGALEAVPGGWRIPADVWFRWNKSRGDIEHEREQKRLAGLAGNHTRHHTNRGITDPRCELCASHEPRTVREPCDSDGPPSGSPESESEPETKSSSSSPPAAEAPRPATGDRRDRVEAAIVELGRRDLAKATARGVAIGKPARYEAACITARRNEHIRDLLRLAHANPDWGELELADAIEPPPEPAARPRRADWTPTPVPDALDPADNAQRARALRLVAQPATS